MIKNHLLIAFRNIQRQPVYTILNILGLATGIAAGLIIALYIRSELSYDKSFPQYDKIYRVHFKDRAESSPLMALELDEAFPEAEGAARLSFFGKRIIVSESDVPVEATGYFADSSFLTLFGINLIEGDGVQALAASGTAVISKSMSEQLFKGSPIGKIMKLDNRRELIIGAVMEDLPAHTHMQFDFLVSMKEFYSNTDDVYLSNRLWSSMYSYIKINSDVEYSRLMSRLPEFTESFFQGLPEKEYMVSGKGIRLMPLKDIHLYSNMAQEMRPNGSATVVYVFTLVEVLILVIACANFTSMFTTQALKRIKQIGMRRIMGATSGHLASQVLTEVTLVTLCSVVVSVIIYQAVLPLYNSLSGNTLGIWEILSGDNKKIMIAVAIGVCLLCGTGPAIFVMRFRPASFLRDNKLPLSFFNRLRNGLVIFQFAVSIFLIAATILIGQQMKLVHHKSLGFDKAHVIHVPLNGYLWYRAVHESGTFNAELLKIDGVLSVGLTSNRVGDDLGIEGAVPLGKEKDDWPLMRMMGAGLGFTETMNISVIQGRTFSKLFNDSSSVLLNESAVKALNLNNPIGQVLINDFRKARYTVVGVIKDYHFASLHHAVEPLLIQYRPEWSEYLVIKLAGGELQGTLTQTLQTLKKESPHSLITYQFLDDRLADLYKSESNLSQVFQFFSILAVTIASLGLISLCAFTVESRTKEIGIRKVMGATMVRILGMVSGSFFKLIVIAFLIAAPVTWYTVDYWLQGFAYRIIPGWWVYALTAGIIFLVAGITTGLHIFKAARSNPVHALRYE